MLKSNRDLNTLNPLLHKAAYKQIKWVCKEKLNMFSLYFPMLKFDPLIPIVA